MNKKGCTKFRKALEAEHDYKGIESSWPSLVNGSDLLTQLHTTLAKHEWMRIVSHNYNSKLLPAMRDCATSAIRGNLRTRTKLYQMKLAEAPNCLFCSDYTLDTPSHRLYQCPNSRNIWNLINGHLMEFRDWMAAKGNTPYSIFH